VLIEGCYIHAFDDAITVKGVCEWDNPLVPEEKRDRATDNVVIDSCVLWCGWGRTCEVGVESSAPEMKNIIFKNCDCIRNAHAVLDARAGWGGHIHHVLFENIRVELHADFQRPVLQREDGHVYRPEESKYPCPAVMVADDKPVIGKTAGKVSDITFRDIYVIAEEGVFKPEVRFAAYNGGVRDIFLERVYYNGELQTDLSRFHTENCNVDPILL
jgi:polygalacturonase